MVLGNVCMPAVKIALFYTAIERDDRQKPLQPSSPSNQEALILYVTFFDTQLLLNPLEFAITQD